MHSTDRAEQTLPIRISPGRGRNCNFNNLAMILSAVVGFRDMSLEIEHPADSFPAT